LLITPDMSIIFFITYSPPLLLLVTGFLG
jgi:hypothetical protein